MCYLYVYLCETYIYIYNICIYAYIYSKQLFTQNEKLNLKNIQQYPTGYI